jgi:hypothetical protein
MAPSSRPRCSSPTCSSLGVSALLLALFVGSAARADEEAAPAAAKEKIEEDDDVDATIIAIDDMEVAKKRGALDRRLRDMGYKRGKRKGDQTIYRPEVLWKPSVVVHDSGFVTTRRSPARFEPPRGGKSKLRYLWCLPPLTPMCVRLGGWFVSPRRFHGVESDVAMALHPQALAWQDAISDRAMGDRISEEVPDELDAIWKEGRPLDPRSPPLSTPEARRVALLDYWADRACNAEGAAVRLVIATYIEAEVMGSPTPATAAELAAANAKNPCGDRLELAEAP